MHLLFWLLILPLPTTATSAANSDACSREALVLGEALQKATPSLGYCVVAGTIEKDISQLATQLQRLSRSYAAAWAAYSSQGAPLKAISAEIASQTSPSCQWPPNLKSSLLAANGRLGAISEHLATTQEAIAQTGLAFARSYVNKPVRRLSDCSQSTSLVKAIEARLANLERICREQTTQSSNSAKQLSVLASATESCSPTTTPRCEGGSIHPVTKLCQAPLPMPGFEEVRSEPSAL